MKKIFSYMGKYFVGIFVILFIVVGVISSPVNLTAQIINVPGTTSTPMSVTTVVIPTEIIDCSDPLRPKTKISFTANPSDGGSFMLLSNTGSLPIKSGTQALLNGTYNWHAVVSSNYVVTGVWQGKFTLDAKCPSVAESSTSTTPTSTTNGSTIIIEKIDSTTVPLSTTTATNTTTVSTVDTQTAEVSFLVIPATTTTIKIPAVGQPLLITIPAPTTIKIPAVGQPLLITILAPTEKISTQTDNRTNIFVEMTVKEILAATTQEQKNEILARINNPASCNNVKECAVYCAQKDTTGLGHCTVFVDALVKPLDSIKSPLLGNINPLGIRNMLEDIAKRPAGIPEAVKNTDDFEQFCSDTKNIEVCSDTLVRGNLASKEAFADIKARTEKSYQTERKVFTERVGARVFVDSDNDGVSDYDEINIYRTNSQAEDTDKDGTFDGKEIIMRTDPLSGEKAVVFMNVSQNNPLVSGISESKLFVVKEVSVSSTATSTEGVLMAKNITFKGTAIPNSFVTLYIYSEPTVVTLKTNASGEWVYTLEKELPDGEHQVIVAITDGGGRVLAKSEPFRFVKVAQAITIGNIVLAVPVAIAEPGFFAGYSLYAFIVIMIGILGAGFLIIGFIAKNRSDDDGYIVR